MAKKVTLQDVSTLDIYGKAALGMLPGLGKPASQPASVQLPDTVFSIRGLKVDQSNLRDYALVTGLPYGDTLPLFYPFTLQFPLMMSSMVAGDFPFRANGSVHLSNSMRRLRPISVTEPLDIDTRTTNLREHRKGMLFDVVSEIRVGQELVCEQTSTILWQQRTSLSGGERPAPPVEHRPPPPDMILAPNLSLIRKYAAASGDRNPIHMGNLAAKALGCNRAIAHGAWSAAAILASVEGQLPDAVRYDVQFGRPMFLPAKVNGYVKPVEGGFDVSILDRKKGFPHLTGTIRGE